MGRKLIQHGVSSLTVSLPRKWVKENNLKKGDEIEVNELKEKLEISTKKHYEHKKIEIDITESKPMIRKIIGAIYKTGYNEAIIKFETHEELKNVQEAIREQFSGFEIINQTKDAIIIKNISQIELEEFNNVLRRFFLVLNQISEETSLALEKNDFEWLKNISLLKIESDKFADFCRRAINIGFSSEFKRTTPLYTIIEELEKVVDRYKEFCDYVSLNKIKANKDLKEFIKDLSEFEISFYKLFYKFNIKEIVYFGRKKEELQKRLDVLASKVTKKELKIITLSDRILNLIFDLNGPLMAVYL